MGLIKEVLKICTDPKKINHGLKEIRSLKLETRDQKEYIKRSKDAAKRRIAKDKIIKKIIKK